MTGREKVFDQKFRPQALGAGRNCQSPEIFRHFILEDLKTGTPENGMLL